MSCVPVEVGARHGAPDGGASIASAHRLDRQMGMATPMGALGLASTQARQVRPYAPQAERRARAEAPDESHDFAAQR